MHPMQWNEEEEMKEHICMLLGSEKKLTELLGSENNKSSFVSCKKNTIHLNSALGLLSGTAFDI